MKSWQVILLVGGVGLVVIVVIMRSSKAKAGVMNSGYPAPGSNNGLASLIGSFAGAALSNIGASKPAPTTVVVPNEGTYKPDTSGFVVTGNQLVDSATGKTLVYGTD